MEYRKLISFGKSSFVVSLPKSWVNQNKLKKGDLVYIDENGSNLILSRSEAKKEESEKTKTIIIDGKPLTLVMREVNSAYITNYRTIILKGKEVKDRIKEVQQVFQNLIALEIMEQSSNSIIAKDFLNMEQVSTEELIHKMDLITRTMIKESIASIFEDNYENINDRDKDVNRLYFLVYRTVLYNMDHLSNALKRFKMGPSDLLNTHFIAFYLEGIADEARRVARYSKNVKNLKDKQKNAEIFGKIEQFYLDTLKSLYEKDVEAALKLSCLQESLFKEVSLIEDKCANNNVLTICSRLRRMISFIHNLGRIVYTRSDY